MKKKITKFWGVGVIVVLLASLLVAAAPTSAADPLTYQDGAAFLPAGAPFYQLAATAQIFDFEIASDGTTIYAVGKTGTSNANLWKSTNGGRTWTLNTALTFGITETDMVAVAPDDPNLVVVVDATTATKSVYYSADGGTIWANLGAPVAINNTTFASDIFDVDISPSVYGTRYVVCAGQSAAGDSNGAGLYIYNAGAISPDWINAVGTEGFWTGLTDTEVDSVQAFEFSTNFLSDFSALAVLEREGVISTKNGLIALNFVNFNTFKWNTLDSYPVAMETVGTANASSLTCVKADLDLAPDYMGGDEVMRVAFAGASILLDGAETGGVYRFMDTIPAQLMAAPAGINSVDFNGSALVAGAILNNNVYRCANPLSTVPTVLSSTSYKRIGDNDDQGATTDVTNDYTIAAWAGDNVLGAKRGEGSAFSISYNNGQAWNDISLIDLDVNYMVGDFWISADGATKYLCTYDTGETSLFRFSGGMWERVLALDNAAQHIVRPAPENNDVIYVTEVGAATMFYTADGGQTRWYPRAISAANDVAVESAGVVYVATGGNVAKSVNNGFIWGFPIDAFPNSADTVASLRSLGENKLIAGGSAGAVSYSTDGGMTWAQMFFGATSGGSAVVTASGLGAGDYVYAATNAGATGVIVSRIQIGTDVFWKDVTVGTAGYTAYGIELVGSALYVLSCNGTDTNIMRTLMPTIPDPAALYWNAIDDGALTLVTTQAPAVFSISSGSNWLWFVAIGGGFFGNDELYYYEDTLADVGPTLIGPADGQLVQMNAASGAVYNVPLQWNRLSLTTDYTLFLALDPMLTQLVTAPATVTASTPTVSNIINAGNVGLLPGTTYYWAVASQQPIGSPFSEIRSFTVQPTAASVPTIGSPANGGVIDGVNPAFSWSPVGGATMYEFQLSADTTFSMPLYSEDLANTGIQPAVALERGKIYFWRVRALTPVQGDWSAIANFSVASEAAAAPPPVEVVTTPAPVINIPASPPATVVEIPPAPPVEKIAPAYIWAIIIIGAVLVIAVIVLIVRTRRSV